MGRLLEKQEQVPVHLPSRIELSLGVILETQDWLYRGRIYQAN